MIAGQPGRALGCSASRSRAVGRLREQRQFVKLARRRQPPGDHGSTTTADSGGSEPTVLAAASLTKVFPKIDPSAKYTFGGSGALETDIEQGAPADVFAAASPKQPAALFAKGLVEKPVEFATNTLVLIVPKSNPAHITSVSDITKPGSSS